MNDITRFEQRVVHVQLHLGSFIVIQHFRAVSSDHEGLGKSIRIHHSIHGVQAQPAGAKFVINVLRNDEGELEQPVRNGRQSSVEDILEHFVGVWPRRIVVVVQRRDLRLLVKHGGNHHALEVLERIAIGQAHISTNCHQLQ